MEETTSKKFIADQAKPIRVREKISALLPYEHRSFSIGKGVG